MKAANIPGSLTRDQQIAEFCPLVRTIARRMAFRLPPHVHEEDLVSVGIIGLIEAVDRYDPERGVPLKAYAEIRIKGAMVDALRSDDWVPRNVRQRHSELQNARDALLNAGIRPTTSLVAAAMGLTQDEYDEYVRDSQVRALLSLDAPLQEEGAPLAEQIGDEDLVPIDEQVAREELLVEINDILNSLSPEERQAIVLSFLQGYTLREIGGFMNVTESRVCQIRTQAVRRIRRRLTYAA